MFEVNLYIETTIKGPAQTDGKWSYLLEYKLSTGDVFTRSECGFEKHTTANRLVLTALKEALPRITKQSNVVIHTDNMFLGSVVGQGWITGWEKNNWKNKKGQGVKNADLWKIITPILERHHIHIKTGKKHGYSTLLLSESKMAAVQAGEKVRLKALETT